MEVTHGKKSYYGHGKLLLSGEYFVLDGALALALPTRYGQHLEVDYKKSFSPKLIWKGLDHLGNVWYHAEFEFWHFNVITGDNQHVNERLQNILRCARELNPHFLREHKEQITVTTKLEFPMEWGLGSSSTLVYNMAQWAYVSPFQLLFKTFGGSGYDIACAQSELPILYEHKSDGPHWSPIEFLPPFYECLYFVYLGKKQSTSEAISQYQKLSVDRVELGLKLSVITREIARSIHLDDFDFLIRGHEELVSRSLGLEKVKDLFFSDFWGEVKSLGAWGGDFVLVTSKESEEDTIKYFKDKGHPVIIRYKDMIRFGNSSGNSTEVLH